MWEGLLEINFQPLQDNIEFGTVLGSILGALGLHFGRILGPKAFQERPGKHDKKEAKTRSTKNVQKFLLLDKKLENFLGNLFEVIQLKKKEFFRMRL